ncbi:hypothetical protein FQA39_LY11558 [Lamprigera yunnana]|nr:hypothetical protein FQA39_LY11558 [Lamprigera yunnana]
MVHKKGPAVGQHGKWWGPRCNQPVLAIHGWQDNAGTFDTLAPLLTNERISVLCIDLPGHGHSSHYPKGHSYYIFWDGVNIVRRLVQRFKWERITILGHSLGGCIAFLYASIYPNDIKSYVAIDIVSPIPKNCETFLDNLGKQIDTFLSYETRSYKDYSYHVLSETIFNGYRNSLTEKSVDILLKRGAKSSGQNEGLFNFSTDIRLKSPGVSFFTIEQILQHASRIKCNVLILKASNGIQYDNLEYYDSTVSKIAKSTNSCEHHVVEGTHHVHLNNPERVLPFIVTFLDNQLSDF